MPDKKRVLILCTGNSARSQMAEGLLRHDAGDRFKTRKLPISIALAAAVCPRMNITAGESRTPLWQHGRTFRPCFRAIREDVQEHIRRVMVSSRDSQIIELWLEKQPSPYTRDCYRRDSGRLLNHAKRPLSGITLADLQSFAQFLIESGLAPISRVRTLAAIKSLFAFCQRMRYLLVNPAAEL